jgi:hypothetical protein
MNLFEDQTRSKELLKKLMKLRIIVCKLVLELVQIEIKHSLVVYE